MKTELKPSFFNGRPGQGNLSGCPEAEGVGWLFLNPRQKVSSQHLFSFILVSGVGLYNISWLYFWTIIIIYIFKWFLNFFVLFTWQGTIKRHVSLLFSIFVCRTPTHPYSTPCTIQHSGIWTQHPLYSTPCTIQHSAVWTQHPPYCTPCTIQYSAIWTKHPQYSTPCTIQYSAIWT